MIDGGRNLPFGNLTHNALSILRDAGGKSDFLSFGASNLARNALSILIDLGVEGFILGQSIDTRFSCNRGNISGGLQNLSVRRYMALLGQFIPFALRSQEGKVLISLFKMRFILFELFLIGFLRTVGTGAKPIGGIQLPFPQGWKITTLLIARGLELQGGSPIPNQMLGKDRQGITVITRSYHNHISGLERTIIEEINGCRMIGRSSPQLGVYIIDAQLLTPESSCRRKGLFWIM